jgi:hypothetical protein
LPRIENRAACERGATTPPDPEAADAVPAGFLHHGALSTFEELGFQRDRPNGEHRWVVRTVVAPRWPGRRSARDTAP